MPRVHCINRKWLEKRKLEACLHQAERISEEVSLLPNKNSGAVTIGGACPPSTPPPSTRGTVPPPYHSVDRVGLAPTGRQCASPKRRRSARRGHDGKNASVITPRGEVTAPDNVDEDSVISDIPVQNARKRKLRSGARNLAISEARIVPHDNDL